MIKIQNLSQSKNDQNTKSPTSYKGPPLYNVKCSVSCTQLIQDTHTLFENIMQDITDCYEDMSLCIKQGFVSVIQLRRVYLSLKNNLCIIFQVIPLISAADEKVKFTQKITEPAVHFCCCLKIKISSPQQLNFQFNCTACLSAVEVLAKCRNSTQQKSPAGNHFQDTQNI